jgi:hypothetical protein
MFAFGVILTFGSLVHHPDMKKCDGRSIGLPESGEGGGAVVAGGISLQ